MASRPLIRVVWASPAALRFAATKSCGGIDGASSRAAPPGVEDSRQSSGVAASFHAARQVVAPHVRADHRHPPRRGEAGIDHPTVGHLPRDVVMREAVVDQQVAETRERSLCTPFKMAGKTPGGASLLTSTMTTSLSVSKMTEVPSLRESSRAS